MTTSASPLVLRRGAGAAAAWSVLGAGLVAAGVYFVVDSSGHVVAWVVLGVFTVVALYFWIQLAIPGALAVHLRPDRLRARTFLRSVEVRWEDVQLARVRRMFGEPTLVVDRHDGSSVRIPLPVGVDREALHRFLAARLGRPSDGRSTADTSSASTHTEVSGDPARGG